MNDSLLRAKAALNSTIERLEIDLRSYKQVKSAKHYFIEWKLKTINDLKEVEEALECLNLAPILLLIESEINSLRLKDDSISSFMIELQLKAEGSRLAFIKVKQFPYE